MTTLAEDALRALDLAVAMRRWFDTSDYVTATERFIDVYYGRADHLVDDNRDLVKSQWMGQERYAWSTAAVCVIEPDVHASILGAAESMPNAPLLLDVLPFDAGMICLPNYGELLDYRPEVDRELTNEHASIGVITWRKVPWIGRIDPITRDSLPSWGVDVFLYLTKPTARRLFDGLVEEWPTWLEHAPLMLYDRVPWAENNAWRPATDADRVADGTVDGMWDAAFDDDGTNVVDVHVAHARRFLLALWTFMSDEIVTTSRAHVPRSFARRYERAHGAPPPDGTLNVITLRRHRHAEGEGEHGERDVEWSHRWWVKGHWRRLRSGRLTWVQPYVKGPEDKPLLVRRDVYVVKE